MGLLPTTKTDPTLTPETAKILLAGPPKIGKTTLAANINPDKTLLLATEPGYGALSVYVVDITSWDQFRKVGAGLAAGKHEFETVVIDTIDGLFKLCQEHIQTEQGVKYVGDLEYGKGWSLLTAEFQVRVAKLTSLGLGVWFISHAEEKEIKSRVGSISRWVPTLSGKPRQFITGFVDFILFAMSEGSGDGERRVLRTQATEQFEAGGRYTLPDPLPLDADALKKAMADACNNRNEKEKTE